jgi:hypothetical protein
LFNHFFNQLHSKVPQSISQTRRRNLLLQLNLYAHEEINEGRQASISTSFAESIGVHKSLLSKLRGEGNAARDISDKMARQIESHLKLEPGWMDHDHQEAPVTSAEASYLELALAAYRATNAQGRSRLRKQAINIARGEAV